MKWISVKDQLPPDEKHVHLFVRVHNTQPDIFRGKYKNVYVISGIYEFDQFFSYDIFNNRTYPLDKFSEVTHWAKIEAPKK